jgi:parvulin-like peptidyl-prolyl isomerase
MRSRPAQCSVFLATWLPAVFLLAACQGRSSATLAPTVEGQPSATVQPPTATSEPMAARIDGDPISLALFEAELVRYERAQVEAGIELATLEDYQGLVLEALIDRRLLAQAALAENVQVDEGQLDKRLAQLEQDLGGVGAFQDWLEAHAFNRETFRSALREDLLAAQAVQRLSAAVDDQAEHAHARHILVASLEEAQEVQRQLLAGANFENLARAVSLDLNSRMDGGDLGWFAPGALTVPELEREAFDLQPGEISEVIQSQLGFHVLEVLERDMRTLSPQAFVAARQEAVKSWLVARREAATIERFIVP